MRCVSLRRSPGRLKCLCLFLTCPRALVCVSLPATAYIPFRQAIYFCLLAHYLSSFGQSFLPPTRLDFSSFSQLEPSFVSKASENNDVGFDAVTDLSLLGYISSFGQCKKGTWRVFTTMDRSKRGKWTALRVSMSGVLYGRILGPRVR